MTSILSLPQCVKGPVMDYWSVRLGTYLTDTAYTTNNSARHQKYGYVDWKYTEIYSEESYDDKPSCLMCDQETQLLKWWLWESHCRVFWYYVVQLYIILFWESWQKNHKLAFQKGVITIISQQVPRKWREVSTNGHHCSIKNVLQN